MNFKIAGLILVLSFLLALVGQIDVRAILN